MSRFRGRRWAIALLIVLIVLGLVVAAASARRMFRRPRGPLGPRQTDVTLIAAWMTVPYIARTFGVPPDELYRGLAVPREGNDRRSLGDMATAAGRSPDEMVAAAQTAVKDFQASHPGPPGTRGPPPEAAP